ncbi:hypothetical protein ACFLS1_05935 [Verrucomicrobiota bacterium]
MKGAALDLDLPVDGPSVLGCGAELKNTVCVTKGMRAYISENTGDLAEYANYALFCLRIDEILETTSIDPEIVAHDLHPDYVSTRHGRRLAGEKCVSGQRRLVGVQHHHAHVAACMVEHGLTEPVIGVALDGMGLGDDGTLWGGEILFADLRTYSREIHFKQYRMPGGDQATLNPDRMAFSCLYEEFGDDDDTIARILPSLDSEMRRALSLMLKKGVRSPVTSSAGRLFDIISAMLGICTTISHEAEAAIKLQAAAAPDVYRRYNCRVNGSVLDFGQMIREIVADIDNGMDKGQISARFHNTIAAGVISACEAVREMRAVSDVVLTGGVFMNDLLRGRVIDGLRGCGFRVYYPDILGPGDAGLSLGQAAVALAGAKKKIAMKKAHKRSRGRISHVFSGAGTNS